MTRTLAAVLLVALVALPACRRSGGQPFTRARTLERLLVTYPHASLPPDGPLPGVAETEGVIYAHRGERALHLDVYRPARDGLFPGVIVVHGGGWQSGDRTMERPFARRLAALGFVTATVEYRLGPEGRFPNALLDLKAAVRWLRANAARHHVDPARMGAVGGSAGGQLVALLGATNGLAAYDESGPGSGDVGAVVALDGLADFTGPALLAAEASHPASPTRFLGGPYAQRAEVWRAASAITHVRPASAPTLFVCSTAPTPILPGRPEMCAKLKAAGVDCQLVTLPGTPHPFWLVEPWFGRTLSLTEAFLGKHLGAAASAAR